MKARQKPWTKTVASTLYVMILFFFLGRRFCEGHSTRKICDFSGVDGSLPAPGSQPAALLELIINILNAYVKAEAKQHDMHADSEPSRLSPDHMHGTRTSASGATHGATDSHSPFVSARTAVSSSDGSVISLAASTRMSVEGAVGAVRASAGGLRGGVDGGGVKLDAGGRFAAAVEAVPPVAVSCAAALRALAGAEGRCWGASEEGGEGGDAARWHLFLVRSLCSCM